MQPVSLLERLVLKVPPWLVWIIGTLTFLTAAMGWALADFSLLDFCGQGLELLLGEGPIEKTWDTIVAPVWSVFALGLPILFGFIYLFQDSDSYFCVGDYLRMVRYIGIFWFTFVIQVVLLPQFEMTKPHVRVCTPFVQEMDEGSLLLFFYGLIEGHGALFTATLEFLAGRIKPGRQVRTQAAWGNKAALWFLRAAYLSLVLQALVLLIVPAAVQWWMPVCVPTPNAHDEKCAYGIEMGLCEYPWRLVLGLYLNIALSLGLRTWPLIRDWWRMRDSKERIGGE